jgi:creatinine amidohydrolase/Fe(II)-dependent formamide hydrolase-like protein
MMEALAPDLVRADRKQAGGAERVISYDIFPAPDDILWPNGVGFSALEASADTGKALLALLIDRLTSILNREFPGGSD